jgi:hypothetical protein
LTVGAHLRRGALMNQLIDEARYFVARNAPDSYRVRLVLRLLDENGRLRTQNMRLEGRYCALADHHDEAHEKCAAKGGDK